MGNLSANYIEVVALILFGIGLLIVMIQNNLIRKIIGFGIIETSLFIMLTARGFISGRIAPIVTGELQPGRYINPLPGGLVLTGIVIAVSITAFMLALSLKLYEYYGTFDMEIIARMAERENE